MSKGVKTGRVGPVADRIKRRGEVFLTGWRVPDGKRLPGGKQVHRVRQADLIESNEFPSRSAWHPSCPSATAMDRTLFIDEAAALLGVSRRTVYYRIRQGRLDTVRTICGSQRVLLASIEQLLQQRRQLRPTISE